MHLSEFLRKLTFMQSLFITYHSLNIPGLEHSIIFPRTTFLALSPFFWLLSFCLTLLYQFFTQELAYLSSDQSSGFCLIPIDVKFAIGWLFSPVKWKILFPADYVKSSLDVFLMQFMITSGCWPFMRLLNILCHPESSSGLFATQDKSLEYCSQMAKAIA